MVMKMMVIAAHPDMNRSRANRAFMLELKNHGDIACRELYREYPDWNIDVEREQQLLLSYDRIVLQFPLYWYSCPPLLKKWFDDVLTYGWAFGEGGDYLRGKEFLVAVTTGGAENHYRPGGYNWYPLDEYLLPIQSTITRCNGIYLPAFATFSAIEGTDEYLAQEAKRYAEYISTSMNALV